MDYQTLEIEHAHQDSGKFGMATVWLNRAELRNAFN